MSHLKTLKVCPLCQSLFLINIHPLLSPPATPEKSLCIPYKLRLGFILTVDLYVTDDQPRQFLVFSMKLHVVPTPPDSWCFLGFRIFFQLKRASRKPFQIPCVFSMKVCLAFKVVVKLCDAVDRAHIPCFFPKKVRLAGIPPHSLGSLSLCFLR